MTDRFARRVHRPERMDVSGVPNKEFALALDEIRLVNRFLGGSRAMEKTLAPFLPPPGGTLTLLDLGSGAADIPLRLTAWVRQRGVRLHAVALDASAQALRYARGLVPPGGGCSLLRADAMRLPFPDSCVDAVTASMFLHHFPQEDAARLLREMWRVARRAVIVNDLYRGRVPWFFIRAASAVFSRSAMFRADAPESVLNGFRKADAEELAALSGVPLRMRRLFPYRIVMQAAKPHA